MRSQTPTDAELREQAPAFAGLKGAEKPFCLTPANLNQPGDLFRPASHNDWSGALISDGIVSYFGADDDVVHKVPLSAFKGVTAMVTYPTGEVSARLVLEHEEENLSVFLTRPMDADDFGFAWEAWLEALDLTARLKTLKDAVFTEEGGTFSGSLMPARRRPVIQILKPRPRRARSFYRERRPKFLVFRNAAMR